MTAKPIRIAVADDHTIFRDGLRRLLELEPDMQIVFECADGQEALAGIGVHQPDLILLDLAMPRASGLHFLREFARNPQQPARVLLLTASIEKPQVVEALRLGARGVVMKDSATQLLIKAIRAVMKGEYWVGRDSVADVLQYLRQNDGTETAPPKFKLTPRETDVVAAVVAGYTNKDIAQKFKISEDTVKHHLTNVFDKVGVSNRLELALFAINHRLVDTE